MTEFEIANWNKHIDKLQRNIIARDFPDVRDGLTETERGVLYSLFELSKNQKTKQNLVDVPRLLGVTMGQYVPLGDPMLSSVITRFSSFFKTQNYPLLSVEGSVESDEYPIYRHWKCQLSEYGKKLFSNIEEECVDYSVNFDGIFIPESLPSAFPNLLCNGSKTIPGHEIFNVKKAILATIENPEIKTEELAIFLGKPKFADNRILLDQDFLEYYSLGCQDIKFHYPNNEEVLIFQASNIVVDKNEVKLVKTKDMIQSYIEYRKDVISKIYIKQNGKAASENELQQMLIESINSII